MRRAFVSHSTSDDGYVAEMESFLRAAGYDDVFNDVSSIRPDEQFWPIIEKRIADADTLVVVITSASNASEWVKREVEYARSLSKKIIPVWIEDCPVTPIFADRDVIDFRPRTRAERRFEISRIVRYAPAELIGREEETKLLNDAWQKVLRVEKRRPRLLTFVALGGEGKTSLVAKWAAEMAHQDWPGCVAAFAWSFYSQGTREQVAASSDLFLKEALTFFGDDADKEFAASSAGAYEKGQRLARLVGHRRSLLILDGLEPLQYAPTAPTPGQLKDQGIAALLKGLAAASQGLCVVTTRYSLPDLRAFWQTTAPEVPLLRLSRAAGVHVLQSFGVKGSLRRNIPFHREQVNEFEKLVEDVQGHALTLNLLGTYLRDAHAGDIRKRDLVKLEEADAEEQGGHAFRVMEAYEREFEREGEKGQRALAVLRLLGLFDRPLTSDCLGALLQEPAIPGLTEPLVDLNEAQRNLTFKRLEEAMLLTVNRDASGALDALDAHPLLREYFAEGIRRGSFWPALLRKTLHYLLPTVSATSPAWRAAHKRLYNHLCATAPECTKPWMPPRPPQKEMEMIALELLQQSASQDEFKEKLTAKILELTGLTPGTPESAPTLSDLQPLYQAIAHGCQANLPQKACVDVYCDRIRRKDIYAANRLGAWASELGAISSFFEQPWSRVSPAFEERTRRWLWGEAGFTLQALGRLTEALGPMRLALLSSLKQGDWLSAATSGANLSELELKMGIIHPTLVNGVHVVGALRDASQSVTSADRSGDAFTRQVNRCTAADTLHQMGGRSEAETVFIAAEQMQAERNPASPLLCSVRGFQYCDLLLAEAERASWNAECGTRNAELIKVCLAVSDRAVQTLKTAEQEKQFLSIALDHLTLGRAALYAAILGNFDIQNSAFEITAAVSGIRRAGDATSLPRALLIRSRQRSLTDARTGSESAQSDLDEAWEIAERGPMKFYMADIHLHRARLFFREAQYPWESPQADLAAAEKLINDSGYHRRDKELADAKAAIVSK